MNTHLRALPDIDEQVDLHTKIAWTLANIESLPPGYSQGGWTLFLMDIPRSEWADRLKVQVNILETRVPVDNVDVLFEDQTSMLLQIPQSIRDELSPKMKALGRVWLADLVRVRVQEELKDLGPLGHNKQARLTANWTRLQVVKALKHHYGDFPVQVDLSQDNTGNFNVLRVVL